MATTFRERVRQQLRDAIMDTARDITVTHGWRAVRMGDVAAAVGVSRQTLYAEFQNKDALADAVAMREVEQLLVKLGVELAGQRGGLRDALIGGITMVLDEARANPLLHAALTAARPSDEGLLPVLTNRGAPILAAAKTTITEFAHQRFPGLDLAQLDSTIDSLIRLVISHLVLRLDPVEVIADRLATLVERSLGASSPAPA